MHRDHIARPPFRAAMRAHVVSAHNTFLPFRTETWCMRRKRHIQTHIGFGTTRVPPTAACRKTLKPRAVRTVHTQVTGSPARVHGGPSHLSVSESGMHPRPQSKACAYRQLVSSTSVVKLCQVKSSAYIQSLFFFFLPIFGVKIKVRSKRTAGSQGSQKDSNEFIS